MIMEIYFWVLYALIGAGTFIGSYVSEDKEATFPIKIIGGSVVGVFWPVYFSVCLVIKLEKG